MSPRGGPRPNSGPKPGPARPHRLDLRLSDEDDAALRALASRWGCSLSEAVRRVVREAAEREDFDPPDPYRPATDDEIAAAERETERDIYEGRRRR